MSDLISILSKIHFLLIASVFIANKLFNRAKNSCRNHIAAE